MSQQCFECGRHSPLGKDLAHYPGCELHHKPKTPATIFTSKGRPEKQDLTPLTQFERAFEHSQQRAQAEALRDMLDRKAGRTLDKLPSIRFRNY